MLISTPYLPHPICTASPCATMLFAREAKTENRDRQTMAERQRETYTQRVESRDRKRKMSSKERERAI